MSVLYWFTLLLLFYQPPVFIDLSKLSKVSSCCSPPCVCSHSYRFNLGRFNKRTVHSLINKVLNGSSEQLSNHSICALHLTVSHWKLLSDCRFQPDLCQDFSQGVSSFLDVTWDRVRSLRCVGSAASSLSTKSHPLESRMGLHQLVLFLWDSHRQDSSPC